MMMEEKEVEDEGMSHAHFIEENDEHNPTTILEMVIIIVASS